MIHAKSRTHGEKRVVVELVISRQKPGLDAGPAETRMMSDVHGLVEDELILFLLGPLGEKSSFLEELDEISEVLARLGAVLDAGIPERPVLRFLLDSL